MRSVEGRWLALAAFAAAMLFNAYPTRADKGRAAGGGGGSRAEGAEAGRRDSSAQAPRTSNAGTNGFRIASIDVCATNRTLRLGVGLPDGFHDRPGYGLLSLIMTTNLQAGAWREVARLSLAWDFDENDVATVAPSRIYASERALYEASFGGSGFLVLGTDDDSDGDGLWDALEMFVHGTDPQRADSDMDGLSDCDEVQSGTDPLDPRSVNGLFADGMAVKLGESLPFDRPPGSQYTYWEYAFYGGNHPAPPPVPQPGAGPVLRVAFHGHGAGELSVGGRVVPMYADGGGTNSLLVALEPDARLALEVRRDDGLEFELDSEAFVVGELPSSGAQGWIAAPRCSATVPCVHDFFARSKLLTLEVGDGFPELAATWSSEGEGVAVSNVPPRSARVTGSFSPSETRPLHYTLSHPRHLCGPARRDQTFRFCPQLPEGVAPAAYEAVGGEGGEGVLGGEGGQEGGTDLGGGDGGPLSPWEGDDPLVVDATAEAVAACGFGAAWTLLDSPTLQLHGGVTSDVFRVVVPQGDGPRCCECPEHCATNYAALVAKSPRLAAAFANGGAAFVRTHHDADVEVRGTEPSLAPCAERLLVVTNGAESVSRLYTVLGLDIERAGVAEGRPPLGEYEERNAEFGYPVTVCTNVESAAALELVTDVALTGGFVRVALSNATGAFQVWLPERVYMGPGGVEDLTVVPGEKLLDSDGMSERHFTMRQWRDLVRLRGGRGTRTLSVKVLSSAAGRCDLDFAYALDVGDAAVKSSARRRITSVNPPLLPDYDGDGRIDASDLAMFMRRRPFRFWTNRETAKGRYVGDGLFPSQAANSTNSAVDGDYDLLGFFPLALDLAQFPQSWRNRLSFRLKAPGWSDASFNYCLCPGAWTAAGGMYTNDVQTAYGESLSAATVTPVAEAGAALPMTKVGAFAPGHGLVVAEAKREGAELRLSVVDSAGREFYGFALPSLIVDVERMYRWANLRWVCGDTSGEESSLDDSLYNPDCETDGRHFVFVHGYNVDAAGARTWANQMFKRLWIAGSRSKFTAVDWCGDSSQFSVLGLTDDISPDYYANVMHAFATASNLVETVAALPGTNKVMLAHSLGNMLVSSAAVDHNLQYDRYYMLNAAVPMEAYDMDEFTSNMVDSAWNAAPLNYHASDWYKLFDNTNDFRATLSWKGRFAGIAKAVNCYSPSEDVLANATLHGYGGAWAKQELLKGTAVWHGINIALFFNDAVSCEGGWGINTYYAANPTYYAPLVGFYASISNLTREAVIEHPLFTPFRVEADSMHSTNLFTVADADAGASLRAKFLADAIPATSFAAGANEISGNAVCGNIDYGLCESDGWPRNNGQWRHSDIKNVAYRYNWMIYRKIINNEGGTNNGNQP